MAERLAALAVVAVTLLALGVTAAALSSPAPGSSSGGAAGTGSSDTRQVPPNPSAPASDLPNPFPSLSPWFVRLLAGAFAALSLATMLAYRGRTFLGGVAALLAIGGTLLVVLVVAWAAGGPLPEPQNASVANASMWAQGGGEGGSGAGSASAESSALQLPGFVFGAVGLVLVAAVGALFYASSSVDETADGGGDGGDGGADDGGTDDVGAAAGRAADRLRDAEDADLPNAVYQAWYEMTTALDVDGPSTSTPREFADAARDAGIDPAAVNDLTRTFESVRYGHDPPEDHERRALDALERIEADRAVASDASRDRYGSSDGAGPERSGTSDGSGPPEVTEDES